MTLIVVDASGVLDYLLGRSESAAAVVTAAESDLHTPALCDVEVLAGLRRAIRLRLLTPDRAEQALEDHLDLPLSRHGHNSLLARALELRNNFGAYDAAYAALAERLDADLLTTDARLASAARRHLDLRVLS